MTQHCYSLGQSRRTLTGEKGGEKPGKDRKEQDRKREDFKLKKREKGEGKGEEGKGRKGGIERKGGKEGWTKKWIKVKGMVSGKDGRGEKERGTEKRSKRRGQTSVHRSVIGQPSTDDTSGRFFHRVLLQFGAKQTYTLTASDACAVTPVFDMVSSLSVRGRQKNSLFELLC